MRRLLTITTMLLGLTACSDPDSGALIDDVGRITADYIVLDLITGETTPMGDAPDLQHSAVYRSTQIVFRRVEGSCVLGSTDDQLGAGEDPPRSSAELAPAYLAICELTQAQWLTIAGTEPWLSLHGSDSAISIGDGMPAVGISMDQASAALAAYSDRHGLTLALPDDALWECACRAGAERLFAWGDSLDPATIASQARCWETAAGTDGAEAVGSRGANAWGFFDLHGNVAELTASGQVRGGSWFSTALACRSAAAQELPADLGHALVGLRLRFHLN